MAQYPLDCFRKRRNPSVRSRRRRSLRITVVDPDGPASGTGAGIDVSPAVACQVTAAEVYSILLGRAFQQAGPRFPAIACIGIIVKTSKYIIQWQRGTEMTIYLFDHIAFLLSPSNVWLIGHNEKQKVVLLESCQSCRRIWKDPKVGK